MAYAPVVCRLNENYTENNINGKEQRDEFVAVVLPCSMAGLRTQPEVQAYCVSTAVATSVYCRSMGNTWPWTLCHVQV